ncbi:hypothetical protein BT96DRAFT_992153 [Gymnopus androsaceus JB14]|uniref:Uncharacterized protein n=1 Tax=Gymnopus androsaceus JB14 TaxID=1447944 RepID=A0A6A4HX61_9AGAR|nr:hypothetical protein BT96DRAFT_992153 [Gymnopus androsaceus JB14]
MEGLNPSSHEDVEPVLHATSQAPSESRASQPPPCPSSQTFNCGYDQPPPCPSSRLPLAAATCPPSRSSSQTRLRCRSCSSVALPPVRGSSRTQAPASSSRSRSPPPYRKRWMDILKEDDYEDLEDDSYGSSSSPPHSAGTQRTGVSRDP